ncbi:MAG TPA: hypothetical protein VEZ42_17050, partial [Pseudonocardia sp.]|nr:hypothetical protein [Pseudonocardia sp.]
LYAPLGRQMFDRAGPLIGVVLAEGAGRDPDLRAFLDAVEHERGRGTAGAARHVAARFGLRPGLTEDEAADVLWALTAPELADGFLRRRDWTLDRCQAWLAGAMADALLGPAPGAVSASPAPGRGG